MLNKYLIRMYLLSVTHLTFIICLPFISLYNCYTPCCLLSAVFLIFLFSVLKEKLDTPTFTKVSLLHTKVKRQGRPEPGPGESSGSWHRHNHHCKRRNNKYEVRLLKKKKKKRWKWKSCRQRLSVWLINRQDMVFCLFFKRLESDICRRRRTQNIHKTTQLLWLKYAATAGSLAGILFHI